MTGVTSVVAPALGFQPSEIDVTLMNRSGARVVGDIVMLDFGQSDAAVDSIEPGDSGSVFANAILPTEAATGSANALALQWGVFAIVLRAAADDAPMLVRMRGIVDAIVVGTAATALGEPLVAVASQDNLDSDVVAGDKVLGICLTATAGAPAELVPVLFDGINGFGNLT